MKYSDRIKVLSKTIPKTGRNLTSHECKKIRKHGYRCSPAWIVQRAYDSEHHGIIYEPTRGYWANSTWTHSGIYVETNW